MSGHPGTMTPLESALLDLRAAVAPVTLPLPLPGADQQRRAVREITAQLDDYVLPRLATIDAPLLAVVGGSTGAGKSTLVNSLVGRRVSAPGVIRPTTRAPVLVHHASDARWFADDRILPGLARSTGAAGHARSLQLVVDDSIPPGLALLDAPDIDSVVTENRQLAAQLLAAADLWLFVTSAARYADAVPWDYLRAAAERSAAVAVVLDRVPPRAMAEVPPHLGQMMSERGLGDSVLFAVPETTVDAEGLLPTAAVQPIRGWLAALAYDRVSRARGGPPDPGRGHRGPGGQGAGAGPRGRRAARGDRRSCAPRSTTPTPRRSAPSRCSPPTAPCCAARCWPAGTSSSAPGSSSARSSRR